MVPTGHLDLATSPETMLSPGCEQHPATTVHPGGCWGWSPGPGGRELLPSSAELAPGIASAGGVGYGLSSSGSTGSPYATGRDTRPHSPYQGDGDTALERGSVQMCRHSWEQNIWCLRLPWSSRAPQKPRPGCTAALPTHGPPPGPRLMGLLQWSPGHWDVPKLPPRLLTSLPAGCEPCSPRRQEGFPLALCRLTQLAD